MINCEDQLRDRLSRIAELERENTENARIIGMSAERELSLRAKVAELESQQAADRERISKLRDLISDISYYAPTELYGEDDRIRDLWVRIRESLKDTSKPAAAEGGR